MAGGEPAAFQNVLAVEMRALAIVRRGRMDDHRLFFVIESRQINHRRIEAEEIVEPKPGMLTVPTQRELTMQFRVAGIANRRDRREAVEGAAQDYDDEA